MDEHVMVTVQNLGLHDASTVTVTGCPVAPQHETDNEQRHDRH
jgi:hypothetical protein